MAFQGDSIFWVEVEKIVANPYQPRREFDEAKLKELAESVRMYGILQPLTVTRREVQTDDGAFRTEYELIAGERRLRASKLANLAQVPVIIREGEQSEQEKLELAIIENLQREDLNAVDRALAFRQLADVFNLPHSQVAKKVGRSREYVSNSIRLLGLPDYMLNSLRSADISEGHARTLLMLNDRPEEQDTVFREILLKKLSVREVERIARGIAVEKTRRKDNIDTGLLELEHEFTEALGTRVSIVKTDFGGKMTIDYFSKEDLETILKRMQDTSVLTTTEQSLPAPGTNRERIELEEDCETNNALEVLTERTGIEVVPDPVAVTPTIKTSLSNESHRINTDSTVSVSTITKSTNLSQTLPEPLRSNEEQTTIGTEQPVAQQSLRDQLSSLLGKVTVTDLIQSTESTRVSMTDADDDGTVAHPQSPQIETSSVSITPGPVRQTDGILTKTNDDSHLYSMNNFGI